MLSKETKRWLRALCLAKCLFEEQAYHCVYLDEIEDFIIKEKTIKYAVKKMTPTSRKGGPNAKHHHTRKGK